jgi:hypothetical protein
MLAIDTRSESSHEPDFSQSILHELIIETASNLSSLGTEGQAWQKVQKTHLAAQAVSSSLKSVLFAKLPPALLHPSCSTLCKTP